MKLSKAAEKIAEGVDETLTYYDFPREHHRHIYTNNPQEAINKQIRRRTRVVGAFPDGNSALMLAARGGMPDVARMLLRQRVDPNHRNEEGYTALVYACESGSTEIVTMLLAAGVPAR